LSEGADGDPPGAGGGGAGNLAGIGGVGISGGAGADGRIVFLSFNFTPTVFKSFSPTTIPFGGTSLVTLTLTNSNPANLTGGAFTDTLVSMSAAGGAVGGTCSGTTPSTLVAGQTSLNFSGITIPARQLR
jgi:hypothetical protein